VIYRGGDEPKADARRSLASDPQKLLEAVVRLVSVLLGSYSSERCSAG